MMCNLCRKILKKGTKYIINNEMKICELCIKICVKIINDPKESNKKITYLNEYRERIGI